MSGDSCIRSSGDLRGSTLPLLFSFRPLLHSINEVERLSPCLGWPIDRILITIQLLELGGYIGRHVDGRWQRLD